MLVCDECSALVETENFQKHLDWHQNVAESFIGFVEILKAMAGPDFQVVIDSLDNRHKE